MKIPNGIKDFRLEINVLTLGIVIAYNKKGTTLVLRTLLAHYSKDVKWPQVYIRISNQPKTQKQKSSI